MELQATIHHRPSHMNRQPRQLVRRTRRQRAHGLDIEDRVWRLSLRGLKQIEIARQVGISPSRVSRYLDRRMTRIEEGAPQAPADLAQMRGLLHERLEAIYASTFEQPTSPASLSARLKCLDSIAKLHGLNRERAKPRQNMPQASVATPAEIREVVGKYLRANRHTQSEVKSVPLG